VLTDRVKMSKTGVILVMFRQKHNLELLYGSLAEQSDKDFKIYFVDNDPACNDTEYSKTLNGNYNLNIEYIKTGENKGFAAGNNVGAKKAISDGCKYIFFLNNDTILENNCLSELIKPIENEPNIAACCPIIFYWKGSMVREHVQEFGASADFDSYKIVKNFEGVNYPENENRIHETLIVDLVSGGATLIKADALAKTGLWEESYFAYGDEIDLARRIKEAEYKCLVSKKAALWHNHRWVKQNKQGYYFEYYLIQRNKYLYFRKYSLYRKMFLSYVLDSVKFPWRLIWFTKVCDLKLGYYYIKGTYAGLLGIKGKPNLSFIK
jgi:GT2 family glycosyltransferase